jgi:hypothetical protein
MEERDERTVLAAEIERTSAAVVASWLERVKTDAAVSQVPVTELRGGVENYLTRLAELLRSAETVGDVGPSAWGDVAREHAITRVRLGFDVTQLFSVGSRPRSLHCQSSHPGAGRDDSSASGCDFWFTFGTQSRQSSE